MQLALIQYGPNYVGVPGFKFVQGVPNDFRTRKIRFYHHHYALDHTAQYGGVNIRDNRRAIQEHILIFFLNFGQYRITEILKQSRIGSHVSLSVPRSCRQRMKAVFRTNMNRIIQLARSVQNGLEIVFVRNVQELVKRSIAHVRFNRYYRCFAMQGGQKVGKSKGERGDPFARV